MMYKVGAALVVAVLLLAAFFLPEWLSSLHDRQLLDSPVILEDQRQEGFAESMQLTVAEKLALLRSGTLTVMQLGQEVVVGLYSNAANGAQVEITTRVENKTVESEAVLQAYSAELEDYSQETEALWEARLTAAEAEVRTLQSLGGLPELWDWDGELDYTGYWEMLYMAPDTRMSFRVYRITLYGEPYTLDLMVDEQSGRILSFELQWTWGGAPNWGLRGASSFGGVWRSYWGMDTVSSGWYNGQIKNILENLVDSARSGGDYSADGQIAFTYDGQSIPISLTCWALVVRRTYSLNWNR